MLVLALLACQSGSVSVGDDPRPPRDTDADTAPADSVEDVGENPAPTAPVVSFDPPAGTFTRSVTVDLALEPGETARYTTDGSDPTTGRAWTAPITLDASAEVRVFVTDGALSTYASASYLALEDEVVGFTSRLPLVVAWTDGAGADREDDYAEIALQVHDGGGADVSLLGAAATSARAGLRVRGSSTSYEPKHSYALELRGDADDADADRALLGMPADSDWVLYAPLDYDRSFLRNALLFRLSDEIGRYAPRTRFVELFEASRGDAIGLDAYAGVYVLMERIRRSPDRVDVEKLAPEDVSYPEVTGGYVFKRDRTGEDEEGFWAGEAGGAFSFADPLVYVYPREEDIERQQAAYLADAVDAFADAVAAADGVGPDGRSYAEHADVASFIDHHILNFYAKNPDALRLSGYMHKDREGPIVAGPLWDFDRAAGAEDSRSQDPTWWDATNITSDTTAFDYGWYGGLFEHAAYRQAYWARWRELLAAELSVEHVHAVIDEMVAEIGEDAATRNFRAWSSYPPRDGRWENEIEDLKGWFAARHAWISACLDARPDAPETCTGG